jgi:hypothetical protein
MAIRILPFGAFEGFSDLPRPGTHYYSQGLTQSLLGSGTLYSLINKKDNSSVAFTKIKHFAPLGGTMFALDDSGNVLKETTPGQYDFTIDHTTSSNNGAGLLADQQGRIVYAGNTYLGLYNGSYNDSWKTGLTSWQHPLDIFENLIVFGNKNSLGIIDTANSDSMNTSAFTLPSNMTVDALKAGPTGVLIGANLGYRSAIILWDTISPRSKTSWKWLKGNILSIDAYGESWIVRTTRELINPNGYTVKQLFPVFDDPLSFKNYANPDTLPQQMAIVNDILIFAITRQASTQSFEFARMKPGIYLYHLSTKAWDFIPMPTQNTITVDVYAIFVDAQWNNRIVVAYSDAQLGKSYVAALVPQAGTRAVYVSEVLGLGHPHYQRVYFGPTDKIAEAAVLNLNILNSAAMPITQTFNVALKVYDFKRPLWGSAVTTQLCPTNQLIVDGTDTTRSQSTLGQVQVGDEITILNGVNAGFVAHITQIQNAGTSTEAWTLDTSTSVGTESGVLVNVQPFQLIGKKTFTALSKLKNIFFNTGGSPKGKQFLLKAVIDNLGANLQIEMQVSYFVFDDIGYDQT